MLSMTGEVHPFEGNFGYARGIQEMLLSCDPDGTTFSLFPALPKEWDGKDVSFRNLRLPGGHRVSAKRAADGTITHEILQNPKSKPVKLKHGTCDAGSGMDRPGIRRRSRCFFGRDVR